MFVLFWFLLIASAGLLAVALYRKNWWAAVLAVVIISFLLYGRLVEPHLITIQTFHLPLTVQPKTWVKTVFLSDLHANKSKDLSFFASVADRVAALKPDLILIGGDMVDDQEKFITNLEPLSHLQASLGKYFIRGNHDFLDDQAAVRRQMVQWGFVDATNRVFPLVFNGQKMSFVGLDDSWFSEPNLNLLRQAARPRLALAHEPDVLLDMKQGDADLVLLGHTHGGQVRLPWIGSLIALPQKAPQWLDRGLKSWLGMPVIISQGLGEADFIFRFWDPPQIVVVEIGI